MKLEQKTSAVTIGGVSEAPQAFHIAATKEAFKALSSGLYNDKIRAVIRELACNAYDAHVAASKKDTPFEVHLPTMYEPWFTIKDFGTGLSHKDVMDLYCTYFSSNKTESNDFTGAFGLGSKSPFAYLSDGGFTVTSHHEGETRIYSAFISEVGTPTVQLHTEEKTPDVQNGLEVMFPVNKTDIWEFENKAKVVFEFFNPTPIFNKEISVTKQQYTLQTDRWAMRQNPATTQGNGLRAIQGNVPYTVGNIDDSRLTPSQKQISGMPLDVFFPIGMLAPAISRESLQLDERTVANVLQMLDEVHANLMDEVKKKIEVCTTVWEARLAVYNMSTQPGIGGLVNDAFNKGMLFGKYANFSLNDRWAALNPLDFNSIQVTQFSRNSRSSKKASESIIFRNIEGEKRTEMNSNIASGSAVRAHYDIKFEVAPNVLFVVNDLKANAKKYVDYFIQRSEIPNAPTIVYLIQRSNRLISVDAAVKEGRKALRKLGNPAFRMASDLKAQFGSQIKEAAPTYSRTTYAALRLKDHIYVNRRGGKYWTQAWQGVPHDSALLTAPGKKFYVVVDKLEATTDTGFYSATKLIEFVSNVRETKLFGLDSTTAIFGLRKNSTLIGNPDWVPFMPHVFGLLPTVMTKSLQTRYTMAASYNSIQIEWSKVLEYMAEERPLSESSPMQQFAINYTQVIRKGKDFNEALKDVLYTAKSRGQYVVPIEGETLSTLWENIQNVYPMLKYTSRKTSSYSTIEEKTALVEYFKLMDETRNKLQVADITLEPTVQKETINVN